ncbi:hypothetical protein ACOME3_003332 [Neoechinorhynchus agilis]
MPRLTFRSILTEHYSRLSGLPLNAFKVNNARLCDVDEAQRSVFYKSLSPIIDVLPLKLSVHRLLTAFELEFVNVSMIPFILPNIFTILEKCEKNKDYSDRVLMSLKSILTMQQMSIETVFIIMRNMSLILKNCTQDDIRNYLLPVVRNGLDSQAPHVQDVCLQTIPDFAPALDTTR